MRSATDKVRPGATAIHLCHLDDPNELGLSLAPLGIKSNRETRATMETNPSGWQLALSILLVAVGGAIGAVARFWLSGAVGQRVGETCPWGTLVVNVSGCFAIGMTAGLLHEFGGAPALWAALVVGVLGSYTTVSSFSLQTMNLMRGGEWRHATGNVVASLLLCLAAAGSGLGLVRLFLAA
jgi:CrcB protein